VVDIRTKNGTNNRLKFTRKRQPLALVPEAVAPLDPATWNVDTDLVFDGPKRESVREEDDADDSDDVLVLFFIVIETEGFFCFIIGL